MNSQETSNHAGYAADDRHTADYDHIGSGHTGTPRAPKRILFGIGAAVVLSFIAIAAGLVIHSDEPGMKASEVFAPWIEFFTGDDGETGEDADSSREELSIQPESSAQPEFSVRSSSIVYEPEDGSYVIRKRYSKIDTYDEKDAFDENDAFHEKDAFDENDAFHESNTFHESNGLVCVYSDETGNHTELLVDGTVTQFSVMDGVLYFTAWDEEAVGWTLYQRKLSRGAEIKMCLPEAYRGSMSFCFFCYEGKIYYVGITDESVLFCYDPKQQSSRPVRGMGSDAFIYEVWDDTFYFVDIWDGTLWRTEPGQSAPKQIGLEGISDRLHEVRICPYQDKIYLAAVAGYYEFEYGRNMLVNPQLCVYALEDGLPLAAKRDLWSFESGRGWQYRDGCFYFLSTDAFGVHVFELGADLDGANEPGAHLFDGNDCQAGQRVLFVLDEKIEEFEVTEHFVYVLCEGQNLIRIYDRLTGELADEIECSGGEEAGNHAGQ